MYHLSSKRPDDYIIVNYHIAEDKIPVPLVWHIIQSKQQISYSKNTKRYEMQAHHRMSLWMCKCVHGQLSKVIVMLWYTQWRQMTSQLHHMTPIECYARCHWHQVSKYFIATSCTIRFFGRGYVFQMVWEPKQCHLWWHCYIFTSSEHSAYWIWRRHVWIQVLLFAPNLFFTNRTCLSDILQ